MGLVYLHQLADVRISLDLLIAATQNDLTFLDNDYFVDKMQKIDSMRDKNVSFVL